MQASFGATRYDHQQEHGFDFWVLRDPWGNDLEFINFEGAGGGFGPANTAR